MAAFHCQVFDCITVLWLSVVESSQRNEACLPGTVVSAPLIAPLSEQDKKYLGGCMTLACAWERIWIREEMSF